MDEIIVLRMMIMIIMMIMMDWQQGGCTQGGRNYHLIAIFMILVIVATILLRTKIEKVFLTIVDKGAALEVASFNHCCDFHHFDDHPAKKD